MVKSQDEAPLPENEFSRRMVVARLPEDGATIDIEADAEERAALARRFDLVSLDRLQARVRLEPVKGTPLWRLTGELEGHAVQRCVVTLEPLPVSVRDEFDELYASPAHVEQLEKEAGDSEGEDIAALPEPFLQGGVDVGEVVAQYFSLALDPAPRKDGAIEISFLEEPPLGASPELQKENPFAVLKKLKGEGT